MDCKHFEFFWTRNTCLDLYPVDKRLLGLNILLSNSVTMRLCEVIVMWQFMIKHFHTPLFQILPKDNSLKGNIPVLVANLVLSISQQQQAAGIHHLPFWSPLAVNHLFQEEYRLNAEWGIQVDTSVHWAKTIYVTEHIKITIDRRPSLIGPRAV